MSFKWMNKPLRFRIFSSFLVALLPVIFFTFIAVEIFLVPSIAENSRLDLENSTHLLTSSVEAAASVAVRNHLKAIAEKNREIVNHYLARVGQGVLSRQEAVQNIRAILLSQRIGSSGYIYCIDSRGTAVIHPNADIEGTDNTQFAFVREQIQRKEGYIEYEWQNPGESARRPKALYMVYLESLDWIISVSSYKSEFNELVDIGDFRDLVLSVRFAESGYAYVIDQTGETLVHPKLTNYNALLEENISSDFVRTMIRTGNGSLEYNWKNPDESEPRRKIAVYENIPEYGWIVVSSSYLDEVMAPAAAARRMAYISTVLLIIATGLASYFLSGRLTRPVESMIRQIDTNARHSSHTPLPVPTTDKELGRLAREFNAFLEMIESKNSELRQERERYRSLFETSPDAVFLLHGMTLIDCNSTTLSIFAGDKPSIIGRTVMDLSPTYQRDGTLSRDLAEKITIQAREYTLQTFDWVHQRCNGQLFDAEVRLKPFGSEGGHPLLVAFVRDITDRKKAENALRESELKYRQLIESATDAIFIAQDEKIVFTNSKTPILTGYSAEELEKIPFSDFIHKEDRSMVVERHYKRLRGDTTLPTSYSFKIKTKDNSERDVLLSTVVIDWNDMPATLNFVRDISEQKKLEQMLQQAQKMDAIGTLAGGIAHDFNNILMGIQGHVSLLKVESDQFPSDNEHLQAIDDHVRSAAGLTRQLLGFARGGKYQPKPTDLNELLAVSAEMFGRTRKEIEIATDFADYPVISEVDRQQIEQVVLNMFVNAWQAMPEGGRLDLATSIVTLEEAYCKAYDKEPGRYAKIRIQDSGVGIESAIQQRIFDPFFTTKQQSRGTGLGLASAYGIVDNHNGFITLSSEVGQGACFDIYLPITERHPLQATVREAEITLGTGTILLIDDEEMIIEVGRSMLEKLGYTVLTASSGMQAVELLQSQAADVELVILDLVMPGMDGGSTFDRIRAISPTMKVILSSGYAMNSLAEEMLKKGCNAFIQKPFSLAELSQTLTKVLEVDYSG